MVAAIFDDSFFADNFFLDSSDNYLNVSLAEINHTAIAMPNFGDEIPKSDDLDMGKLEFEVPYTAPSKETSDLLSFDEMMALRDNSFIDLPSSPPQTGFVPIVNPVSPRPQQKIAKATSPKKRQGKKCIVDGCTRRAQSMNRCKSHGGGARCQAENCFKSSQGGGFCRSHGGGKKCNVVGCDKGTQRNGLCYQHGGIRHCQYPGCEKKDRGSGFCIAHGGGKRCELRNCGRAVRKGNRCRAHMVATAPKAQPIVAIQPLNKQTC